MVLLESEQVPWANAPSRVLDRANQAFPEMQDHRQCLYNIKEMYLSSNSPGIGITEKRASQILFSSPCLNHKQYEKMMVGQDQFPGRAILRVLSL
ncbi:signal recognition particle 14 kDa protein isoform 3-T3 [Vipera latastei]